MQFLILSPTQGHEMDLCSIEVLLSAIENLMYLDASLSKRNKLFSRVKL